MKEFEERTVMANGTERIRRFRDMDGGSHYKWTYFALGRKEYPVGSMDVLCRHEIDWTNTKEIAA